LTFLATVLPTASAQLASSNDPAVQIAKNARSGTVRIEAHMPLENRMGTFGKALKKKLQTTDSATSTRKRWYVSMGSGVIWDARGHIVTTLSIVEDASKIKVFCVDGSEFDAELIGADDITNLAVLRITEPGLRPLNVIERRDTPLPEGSWLILMGYGYGGIPTVSPGLAGIPPEDYDPGRHWFQFTAALRPGNSGSALIDRSGKLAGIVLGREEDVGFNAVVKMLTQGGKPGSVSSQMTAYSSFGVGVPANQVTAVVDQIIRTGHVVRGWIGISVRKVLEPATGEAVLQVVQIVPESPADAAGLQAGDQIQCINAVDMQDPVHLGHIIQELPPGTKIPVDFMRQGQNLRTEIIIGERPHSEDLPSDDTAGSNDTDTFNDIQILNNQFTTN